MFIITIFATTTVIVVGKSLDATSVTLVVHLSQYQISNAQAQTVH
jgi:hypothetical protein